MQKIFLSHGFYSPRGNREALRDGVRHNLEEAPGMSPESVLAFLFSILSYPLHLIGRYLVLTVSNCR